MISSDQPPNRDTSAAAAESTAGANRQPAAIRQRVRFRFRKQDAVRWIGHLDLVRTMERMFRRAKLPLGMSEGFHPKPRMNFPSPLPVGVSGREEVVEVELSEVLEPAAILAALEPVAPPGIVVDAAELIAMGTRKAHIARAEYQIAVPAELHADLRRRMDEVLAQRPCMVDRGDEGAPLDLHDFLEGEGLALRDGVLYITLRVSQQRSVRPREILGALNLADIGQHGCFLERSRVELE